MIKEKVKVLSEIFPEEMKRVEADEYGDSEIEEMKQEQNQKYFEVDYQGGVEQ